MYYRPSNIFSALLLSILLAFTGCGGGGGGNTTTPPVTDDAPESSTEPVVTEISLTADAGREQNVLTTSAVTLDGSESENTGSTDKLTYSWDFVSKPTGSNAILSDDATVNPQFTADRNGLYELQLTVNSGPNSDIDTVLITASTENLAPTTDAGADQNVKTGTKVTLDGSKSDDANGDNLTYRWSFVSKAAGSSASLSGTTTAQPTFTADRDGIYQLRLLVSDGTLESSPDMVSITASTANSAPVANAGTDQNKNTGARITLDGSASSDANSDDLTYRWSFISIAANSSARLSNPTAVKPTFTADRDGTYILQLLVDDGTVESSADRVSIIASTANSAPKAYAGDNQNVNTGTNVTLDGSKSSDANSDDLTYKWTVVSSPDNIDVSLSSTTTAKPTFSADRDGTYIFSLIVNDGAVNSTSDRVTITASTANSAPVVHDISYQGTQSSEHYPGEDIYLVANASDANSDALDYIWTFQRPKESTARILDSQGHTEIVQFTPDVPGEYTIKVTADDGSTTSNTKSIVVQIESYQNQTPIADPGPDVVVESSDSARFDGSGSYDAEGDDLTYRWRVVSVPAGASSTFWAEPEPYIATMDIREAGDYVMELIVNDGTSDSEPVRATYTLLTSGVLSMPLR